jgi:hypothetical protein
MRNLIFTSRGTPYMNKGNKARLLLLVTIFLFSTASVFPYSDQTTTERILKENRRFVEFVNPCVTNFADDKKEDFLKAYNKHFNADVAYLQSDYRRAFKRVYSSQGDMEKLYRDLVKNYYLEDSKTILDRLAPDIIRSKNKRARLYLTLGYRDRTVSWVHYTVADASNPKLYSYKLYKYVDAIKMARRSKRYAFLALFESQNTETKRKIYNQLCRSEGDSGSTYMVRFVGLNDQDYINEMGKTYEEHEKAEKARNQGQQKKEADKHALNADGSAAYEAKVVKRVRFRNEARAARYLINGEFDMAEDLMRVYIDDFNFKLITATFDVLSARGKEGGAETSSAARIDYDKYKIHLLDNYSRIPFTKKSMLDTFVDLVRVEDDISMKDKEEQGTEAAPAGDEKKKESTAAPENKEDAAIKTEEKKEEKQKQ